MWNKYPMHFIADVVSGFGFPTAAQGNQESKIPFYKVNDMNHKDNQLYMTHSDNYVDDRFVKIQRYKLFPKGTIIFPKIGAAIATGKKRILSEDSLFDNNIMGVMPKEKLVLSKFLYYWTLTFDFTKISNIGPVPSIRKETVNNLLFSLPTISEQRRIVEILDQADKIRKLRKQADEKAEKIIPALFYEMFGDPLTHSGIMTIREIVKKVEQKDFKKYPDIEFNYVDISSVDGKTGKIISYTKYFGSEAPSRAKQIIKHNDVIISTVRPYLKATALVPKDLDNQVCSTGFCVIRTKADYGFGFLYALSRLNWFSEKLMTMARGASYPAVSDSDILNMSIPYPTQNESLIKKFDDIIINLELKRDLREQANKKIQNLFDLLLSKAFDGSLTASWREAHMKELLQEMEEQKKYLEKEI